MSRRKSTSGGTSIWTKLRFGHCAPIVSGPGIQISGGPAAVLVLPVLGVACVSPGPGFDLNFSGSGARLAFQGAGRSDLVGLTSYKTFYRDVGPFRAAEWRMSAFGFGTEYGSATSSPRLIVLGPTAKVHATSSTVVVKGLRYRCVRK